jgi:hypothetical protein
MIKLPEKLVSVAKAIAEEKGRLDLFALFKREDATLWDVVVAAPWAKSDIAAAIHYVVDRMRESLKPDDFEPISRVAILTGQTAPLASAIGEVSPGDAPRRASNFDYRGSPITDAYFIALRGAKAKPRKARQPN